MADSTVNPTPCKRWLMASLVGLISFIAIPTASPCIAQKALSSSQKRQIDKAVAKVKKAESTAEKRSLVKAIAPFGDRLHSYLLSLAQKHPERGEILETSRLLDWCEGKDLDSKEIKAPSQLWSAWTIPLGSILMVKGIKRWAAIQVGPKYDPDSGTLEITVAKSNDPLARMGGAGVDRETLALEGKDRADVGAAGAFTPKDYSFKIFGGELILGSAGSEAFRFKHHPGAPAIALTGQIRLNQVKGGDKRWVYRDRPPQELANECRRLQQYAFRLIDGLEPLPTYGTDDEAQYKDAEQVQVEMREGAKGEKTLCISFPHSDESIAFTGSELALLQAFSKRRLSVEPKDILVWIGKGEAHETNWFYTRGKWKRPTGSLLKRVRALFPEDY